MRAADGAAASEAIGDHLADCRDCRQIMDEHIVSEFKQGRFSEGIVAGVEALDKTNFETLRPVTPLFTASRVCEPLADMVKHLFKRAEYHTPSVVRLFRGRLANVIAQDVGLWVRHFRRLEFL